MDFSPIKLVILDRDGVLNVDNVDYVKSVAELMMLDGVGAAVATLNKEGPVVIATNQSCIGKGILTAQEVAVIHDDLRARLAQDNATIDKIYVAPDTRENPSPRRKPGPGMLHEAMADFSVTPAQTLFVGDSITDLQAAEAAGCLPVLVRTGKGSHMEKNLPSPLQNVMVFDTLSAFVSAFVKGRHDV